MTNEIYANIEMIIFLIVLALFIGLGYTWGQLSRERKSHSETKQFYTRLLSNLYMVLDETDIKSILAVWIKFQQFEHRYNQVKLFGKEILQNLELPDFYKNNTSVEAFLKVLCIGTLEIPNRKVELLAIHVTLLHELTDEGLPNKYIECIERLSYRYISEPGIRSIHRLYSRFLLEVAYGGKMPEKEVIDECNFLVMEAEDFASRGVTLVLPEAFRTHLSHLKCFEYCSEP